MKQIISHTLTALLLLTIFTACGFPPHPTSKDTANPSNGQPIESSGTAKNASAQTIERLLERQDYAKAIRLASEESRRNATRDIDKMFVLAMNGGLKQADLLLQSEAYDSAAEVLKAIKDDYPLKHSLQQQLTRTSSQIIESFNLCTQKMMDAGLLAYRSGDFPGAIDIWEKIVAVDPQHAAALNSLQTTRMQMSKLKDLNNKN